MQCTHVIQFSRNNSHDLIHTYSCLYVTLNYAAQGSSELTHWLLFAVCYRVLSEHTNVTGADSQTCLSCRVLIRLLSFNLDHQVGANGFTIHIGTAHIVFTPKYQLLDTIQSTQLAIYMYIAHTSQKTCFILQYIIKLTGNCKSNICAI